VRLVSILDELARTGVVTGDEVWDLTDRRSGFPAR
jgi:hypothetical protein